MNHPGAILKKYLENSFMSRKELALRTGVTEKHISTILNGERNISISFARKLGYVFENANFWSELQSKFDVGQLKLQEENSITEDEIGLLKRMREIMNYLVKCGYISNDCGDASKVLQLREFLNISDLTQIPKITYNAAYRAQLSTNVRIDPYVLFAWQRLCEKETEEITVNESLDKELLQNELSRIRTMMLRDITNGIKKLQDIFARCGIAFQVVKNFRGAPVQGFIKKTIENKLILCLTIRRQRADVFWFTLFHEIAHILNNDFQTRFVDFESVYNSAEEKADDFARNTLIPPEKYRTFISENTKFSWSIIESFAKDIKIKPFIVLGRLQNDGYLDWTDYADKIEKYAWA